MSENYLISGVIFVSIFMYYQFKTTFILNSTFELVIILIYQLFLTNSVLTYFEKIDEVTFMIINTILNVNSYMLILACYEMQIMLFLFFTHLIMKFFRLLIYDKIKEIFGFILDYLFQMKSEADIILEKMNMGKKSNNGKLIDEKEILLLNNNLKSLSIMSSDISLNLIMISYLIINIQIQKKALKVPDSNVFLYNVFLVVLCATFFFDIFNLACIFYSSESKHCNFYLKLVCYSLSSIVIESESIYLNRNAVWALNSDTPLKLSDYRMYDEKFERLRRLGFSSQLFIINIIYGYSFIFMTYGLSMIDNVNNTPWFDPYFGFSAFLCIISF